MQTMSYSYIPDLCILISKENYVKFRLTLLFFSVLAENKSEETDVKDIKDVKDVKDIKDMKPSLASLPQVSFCVQLQTPKPLF